MHVESGRDLSRRCVANVTSARIHLRGHPFFFSGVARCHDITTYFFVETRERFMLMECESAYHSTREAARSRCLNCSGCKCNCPSPPASRCGSPDCWPCRFWSSPSGCRSCPTDCPERGRPRGTRRRRTALRGTVWLCTVWRLYSRSSRTCRGRLWSRSLALETNNRYFYAGHVNWNQWNVLGHLESSCRFGNLK